ncbi:MAG: hypothetical protein ACLGGX_02450 [Bdellovibrionia bacterium]
MRLFASLLILISFVGCSHLQNNPHLKAQATGAALGAGVGLATKENQDQEGTYVIYTSAVGLLAFWAYSRYTNPNPTKPTATAQDMELERQIDFLKKVQSSSRDSSIKVTPVQQWMKDEKTKSDKSLIYIKEEYELKE